MAGCPQFWVSDCRPFVTTPSPSLTAWKKYLVQNITVLNYLLNAVIPVEPCMAWSCSSCHVCSQSSDCSETKEWVSYWENCECCLSIIWEIQIEDKVVYKHIGLTVKLHSYITVKEIITWLNLVLDKTQQSSSISPVFCNRLTESHSVSDLLYPSLHNLKAIKRDLKIHKRGILPVMAVVWPVYQFCYQISLRSNFQLTCN